MILSIYLTQKISFSVPSGNRTCCACLMVAFLLLDCDGVDVHGVSRCTVCPKPRAGLGVVGNQTMETSQISEAWIDSWNGFLGSRISKVCLISFEMKHCGKEILVLSVAC
jgi:hypothetical protein